MVRDVELTIDELAHEVGMTARNVRAYQTRGLLPQPRLRGRTAIYGAAHVRRLQVVKQVHAAGVPLEDIGRLVERMPTADAAQLLALADAESAPFDPEQPLVVSADVLRELWGDQATPELEDRAARMAHIRRLEDGRFEVRSARLFQAAVELAEIGVPLAAALDLVEDFQSHLQAVAASFVTTCRDYVDPAQADLDRVTQRLRVLLGHSTLALLGIALDNAVSAASTTTTKENR